MNVNAPWPPTEPGVLALPSGRLVRGRGLRRPKPGASTDTGTGRAATPDFGLYLLGRKPADFTWPTRWIRWPDFWVPRDREDAVAAITEAWQRAEHQRVEVACGGGKGRTGTALACMAVLDGMHPDAAIEYVRENYDRHAVETPWQRRFVRHFPQADRTPSS